MFNCWLTCGHKGPVPMPQHGMDLRGSFQLQSPLQGAGVSGAALLRVVFLRPILPSSLPW